MAYVKQVWNAGDLISATKLNNVEKQYDSVVADYLGTTVRGASFKAVGTNQSIGPYGYGSYTYLTWSDSGITIVWDNGNVFDGTTFTAPVAGYYLFGYQVQVKDMAAGEKLITSLYKFSPTGYVLGGSEFRAAASGIGSAGATMPVKLEAGDTVRVRAAIHGGDVSRVRDDSVLDRPSWFWGVLLMTL